MKTNILCQVQRRANGIAIAVGAIALAAITLVTSGCATSNTAAAHNAQGVERFTSGQYDDAIALFQASLEENPDSAETYYNLGSAYQRKAAQTGDLKLLDQAEDAYWTALDLNPAPETIVCCYRGLATSATTRGDSAGALATLEEWRDRNPQSIEPKLEIAYLLEAQEKDAEAYKLLKEIAEEAPGDYRAYYKMGALAERAGDLADAVENANLAVKLNPNDSNVVQRANILEAQYAAKQRKGEANAQAASQEIDSAQADKVVENATEQTTVVADAATTQTTRVPSTSAQTEQEFNVESTTEIVMPEDAVPTLEQAPAEPDQEGANDETQPLPLAPPSASAAPQATQLGFSEVATIEFRSPSGGESKVRSVAATTAKRDDSDVKWITSPTAERARKQSAEMNAKPERLPKITAQSTAPQGFVNPNADGEGAVKPVFVKVESEPATNVATNAATTERDANSTNATAKRPGEIDLNAPIKSAPEPSRRRLPALGSGPPNLKAGSIF